MEKMMTKAHYEDIDMDVPADTHCVWYHSAGCLPDSEYPEFSGDEDECEAWIQTNHDDYDTSVLYVLSVSPVDY